MAAIMPLAGVSHGMSMEEAGKHLQIGHSRGLSRIREIAVDSPGTGFFSGGYNFDQAGGGDNSQLTGGGLRQDYALGGLS